MTQNHTQLSSNEFALLTRHSNSSFSGNKYVSSEVTTGVGAAGIVSYLLITPNTSTRISLLFNAKGTTGLLIRFFESPTITANGNALSARNQNRNSSNTASLQVLSDPTITANGTLLFTEEIGSTTQPGVSNHSNSSDRDEKEFILAQNTQYLLRLTALAASTDISAQFWWYEIE